MEYLHWDEKIITDLSEKNITDMYDRGYVFTRIGKGVMHQTRSVRIDLSKFELSSENRRILKKIDGITLNVIDLPLADYTWKLGKTAKDFYDMKFGPGIMSAQKVKEIFTAPEKSNFNCLLKYSGKSTSGNESELGFVISYSNDDILHYSYPFYHIDMSPKDMGLGMMTFAIQHAKNAGMKYVYLGSLQRPTDTYKFQFSGLEWFDGGAEGTQKWLTDVEKVKGILRT
jgi:arginyl-tRNA--protein-N-Asp/Glu arginylyltransferase